jgi:hypothetical protein
LLKKRVNELVVPSFLIRDPKVFNKRWIHKVWVLNDEIIVDIFPRLEPRRTPKRDVSLSDLIEGMGLEKMKNFQNRCPKG